jgi:hypothetical protein
MHLQSSGGRHDRPSACPILQLDSLKCSALFYTPASVAILLPFENAVKERNTLGINSDNS